MLEDNKKRLLSDMKRTKGARFNAAERLEQRYHQRNQKTAFASIAVIILTIIPAFIPLSPVLNAFMSLLTVGSSIIILAFTLLQYSFSDARKAEQLDRCALEINTLRRRLNLDPNVTAISLMEYAQQYDSILAKYPVNHNEEDTARYRSEHPEEFSAPLSEEEKKEAVIARKKRNRIFSYALVIYIIVVLLAALASFLFAILKNREFLSLLSMHP